MYCCKGANPLNSIFFKRADRQIISLFRERIRQVLSTSSVLELQRQLLTAVMENEVGAGVDGLIIEWWRERLIHIYISISEMTWVLKLGEVNDLTLHM